jgi:outer membrane receptor protein involved in Fe transport
MTGVFVQKTNHGGGSPFVRGLTGNQTLLLMDGIRLSNATTRYGPNQYFNTLDVFSLGKIEVLRGSGAVQYGTDAIGGTIQAFSRETSFTEKPSWRSMLNLRFATQGMEQSLNTGMSYGSKKAAFNAGLTWRNFGDIVGGDTTGRQSPSAYSELDFDLKGKVLISPRSTLTIVYQNVHQEEVDVYHKIALEDYAVNKMDPQNRRLAYIRLNQELNSGIWKNAAVTFSLQNTEEGRYARKNGSEITRVENDRVRSLGFSVEAVTSQGEIWSANSGIELYNDLVSSKREDRDQQSGDIVSGRGLYPDGSGMTSLAAFTMHRVELKDWNFSTGIRYNSFIIRVDDTESGNVKLTPSAFIGNIAVMRKLGTVSNVFFSVNTGFRSPNIDDMGALGIVDFRYEIPNFDLRPERSVQYELGYKLHSARLKGEFFVYHTELKELIVRSRVEGDSIDGYPVYVKENAEHSYIQGLETTWEFEMAASWLISGNLTYTYGQNITKSEPVRRIPPLFGRLALEYSFGKAWTCLEWQAAAKQSRLAQGDIDDNRIPDTGTPGWNVLNLHAGYTCRFLRTNISLQNIFNTDYRYHGSGVNGYGRSAILTISFLVH